MGDLVALSMACGGGLSTDSDRYFDIHGSQLSGQIFEHVRHGDALDVAAAVVTQPTNHLGSSAGLQDNTEDNGSSAGQGDSTTLENPLG